MTINNKSERNYRGKCLGSPVTSYGGGSPGNFIGVKIISNILRFDVSSIIIKEENSFNVKVVKRSVGINLTPCLRNPV